MIRMWLVSIGMILSATAAADTTLPERVPLPKELLNLAKEGTAVVQQDDNDGIQLTAAVYVQAGADAIMKAIMDLPPRVTEIDGLVGLTVYKVGPHTAAHWQLDAKIKTVDYYVIYECNWSQHYCVFGLDPSKQNEIEQADGAYRVIKEEDGSWLEYHSQTQPHPLMPAQIRKVRREQTTQQMLMGIKQRAESSN